MTAPSAKITTARNTAEKAVATLPRGSLLRGPLRLGRRTKELTARLTSGAIVVLDHADLDTVAARSLLRTRPIAVINNQPFVTGRYPNRGPGLLQEAGVPLFDLTNAVEGEKADLFSLLTDGDVAAITQDEQGRTVLSISSNGSSQASLAAYLVPLTPVLLEEKLAAARSNLDSALSDFAQNTLRYLHREEERALLLDPVAVPEVSVSLAGRPALVVVRGDNYEDDLRRLAPYLREQKPVVIAVDGAADALIALGIRPHILLGDMDSVTDSALRCGAELIVHAYSRPRAARSETDPEPDAPGMVRIRALGLEENTKIFPVAGTSEDAALLLAYEKGADLIVAVGTHTNLEDFLDKGRGGMASTFLVRLKVGSRLVDARGVSRLYTSRQRVGPMLGFLALAALFPIVVLLTQTPWGQVASRAVAVWFRLRNG
ncbi:MAG: putative cytokinetic ring protein SteA [Armatimonadota bacterium]